MDDVADAEYLRSIERLAHEVVEEAAREGWLAFIKDREIGQTPLQRAINELARNLRMTHFEGDGCVSDH